MSNIVFTHTIKKSNKLCFPAVWWPSRDPAAGNREKHHPLMFIKGGQITRININNLKKIR